MRFLLRLHSPSKQIIGISYQYELSAALYRIIAKGDAQYAGFLHEKGYGKGLKLFSFSQISCPFKVEGDRFQILSNEITFQIAFHLPQASENFIKGLFQSEKIEIADRKSRAVFNVASVKSLANPLQQYKENEMVSVRLRPLSPIVAGLYNDKGQYTFISPEDSRFASCIVRNWQSKIEACYDESTKQNTILLAEPVLLNHPPKSKLLTIKANTPQETKIRGWMNFELKVTAERRFLELLMNAGAGVYNSMGCGCVEVGI